MILNGECGAFNPLLLECLTDIKDHIQEELTINSLDRFSEKEIHAITEQLLAKKELSASNRTLSMLEEERIKFQFFSTLASEIQFEYTAEPSMLTLSDWGAKKLGISRFIRNPLENEKLLSIISQKQMLQLAQTLRSVTPEHPVIECNAVLKLGNTTQTLPIICHTLWTSGSKASYSGAIGKIIDIPDESHNEPRRS